MHPFTQIPPIYDRLMSDIPYDKWVEYIEQILKQLSCKPKKILDLACGTGTVAFLLIKRGYKVVGVDSSEGMLNEAERKSKNEKLPLDLIHSEMQNFRLREKVELAICLFDSLNYLLKEKDLENTFWCVFEVLTSDGIFIFDMNTEYGLSSYWGENIYVKEQSGLFSVWQNRYDQKSGIATLRITIFAEETCPDLSVVPACGAQPVRWLRCLPNGQDGQNGSGNGFYRRYEELHRERAYTNEEIKELLKKANFQDISFFKHRTFIPPTSTTTRIMVVARKGSNAKNLTKTTEALKKGDTLHY
ncbi:MAG: class I SAM-dependent methyltransferase [Candidatus Edwardsbacteria bacterium]